MPITEEKAIAILEELIRKPETKAEDVARIWSEIIGVYNQNFSPVEEPKKKKRKRATNPNIGWPQGVKRQEYKAWKEAQEKNGVTEGLNPQEYKRQLDAGMFTREKYGSEFSKPETGKKTKDAPQTKLKTSTKKASK